jgi:hypothetical protein
MPPGACRGVVNRAHHAGLAQNVVVLDEDQVDHQADDFARREMLPGRLVADFRELADQLFEHEPHLHVADDFGMQVDAGEFLGDLVQQAGLGKPVDLGAEFEALEHVAHRRRERLHVADQVGRNVVGIAHQHLHVEGRGVVEALARLAQQERLRVQTFLQAAGVLFQNGRLGRLQHAIEAPQHGEREDDFAVVGLFVVAAEKVGDGPYEGGESLLIHSCKRKIAVVRRGESTGQDIRADSGVKYGEQKAASALQEILLHQPSDRPRKKPRCYRLDSNGAFNWCRRDA